MEYRVKEINLHITEHCSGHCPMCYATEKNMQRKHGDLETLKKIVHNSIANGKVERFVMVGGDPCEYPYLVDLLKYIKKEGNKYNINTKSMVISNTHDYKENGKPVNIQDICDYLDGVCFTVHGATAEMHDEFNGCLGSFEHAINNLNEYAKVKTKKQEICIIINLMPSTVNQLEEIILNITNKLNGVNCFAIQRIAPIGRACGTVKYFIEQKDVNNILRILKNVKEKYGYFLEFVDAFPLCIVKPEYKTLLPKGRL